MGITAGIVSSRIVMLMLPEIKTTSGLEVEVGEVLQEEPESEARAPWRSAYIQPVWRAYIRVDVVE